MQKKKIPYYALKRRQGESPSLFYVVRARRTREAGVGKIQSNLKLAVVRNANFD